MKQHTAALVLAVIGILFLLAYAIPILLASDMGQDRYMEAGLFTVACVVLGFVIYPQRIEVREGVLKIRSGLWVMKRVRLADVTRVYASKGWPLSHTLHPVTGYRLSVGKKQILVIPDDEPGFLEEVARQAPHLRRYGNELRGDVPVSQDVLSAQ